MSTDLIKIDAAKAAGTLSTAVTRARAMVEQASDEIARDLVQVQAGSMIREAMTDDVKALILACGTEGHYEIVSTSKKVEQEQIIAVCVAAYLRGLSLTGQQFAVFPKRGGGAALYIKSNGYRHLFARCGHASDVSVSIGYPEMRPLETAGRTKDTSHETGGKAVALMAGKVSVVWDGKTVSVEASGEYRVGIPCYVTDNIDGLQAKAERRLLARLWAKCTGIREADPETTDEVEPVTYEVVPDDPAGRDWDAEKAAYVEEWKALPDGPAKDLYLAVMRSVNRDELESLVAEAAKEQMDRRHRDSLTRAADWKREWLASREDMP